ncbi:uncharacterized protein LOC108664944 [Hyalella azteca]|uniref:Uncharacterized protein LOC108664944 n=1 Tax=Hyalella azteca TaxID=294128 RepID=A0A8B7N0R3_HYAAZ|nr:uncharacterized protein LOC108664944 [Hyalella azteca]
MSHTQPKNVVLVSVKDCIGVKQQRQDGDGKTSKGLQHSGPPQSWVETVLGTPEKKESAEVDLLDETARIVTPLISVASSLDEFLERLDVDGKFCFLCEGIDFQNPSKLKRHFLQCHWNHRVDAHGLCTVLCKLDCNLPQNSERFGHYHCSLCNARCSSIGRLRVHMEKHGRNKVKEDEVVSFTARKVQLKKRKRKSDISINEKLKNPDEENQKKLEKIELRFQEAEDYLASHAAALNIVPIEPSIGRSLQELMSRLYARCYLCVDHPVLANSRLLKHFSKCHLNHHIVSAGWVSVLCKLECRPSISGHYHCWLCNAVIVGGAVRYKIHICTHVKKAKSLGLEDQVNHVDGQGRGEEDDEMCRGSEEVDVECGESEASLSPVSYLDEEDEESESEADAAVQPTLIKIRPLRACAGKKLWSYNAEVQQVNLSPQLSRRLASHEGGLRHTPLMEPFMKPLSCIKAYNDGEHHDGGYPDSGHPDDGYPDSGYPDGGYPDGGHPDGGYPDGVYPVGGHPDGGYPDGGQPNDEHPDGGYPDGGQPNDEHPDGGHPNDEHPDGGYPNGGYPDGGYPDSGYPNGVYPDDGHSECEHHNGEHPVDERPGVDEPEDAATPKRRHCDATVPGAKRVKRRSNSPGKSSLQPSTIPPNSDESGNYSMHSNSALVVGNEQVTEKSHHLHSPSRRRPRKILKSEEEVLGSEEEKQVLGSDCQPCTYNEPPNQANETYDGKMEREVKCIFLSEREKHYQLTVKKYAPEIDRRLLLKGEQELSQLNYLGPSEVSCVYCRLPLGRKVLYSNNACLLDPKTVVTGIELLYRKCRHCGLRYFYKEFTDGVHLHDELILSLDLCLMAREFLRSNGSLPRTAEAILSFTRLTFPDLPVSAEQFQEAYSDFEAMCGY